MKKIIVLLLAVIMLVSCAPDSSEQESSSPEPSPPSPTASPAPTKKPTGDSIMERPIGEEKFSLLEDRLYIKMPEGTESNRRFEGVMFSPVAKQTETRLTLYDDGEQMTMFAQELFAYSRGDFEENISYIIQATSLFYEDQFVSKPTILDNGLEVITAVPTSFPDVHGNIFLRSAYVKLLDDTIINLGFYVTPGAFINEDICVEKVDQILNTLEPGTKELGKETFNEELFGDIEINIQEGYAFTSRMAPFTPAYTYDIYKLNYLDDDFISFSIYIGSSDYTVTRKLDEGDDGLTLVGDTILGKKITWKKVKSETNDRHFIWETLFKPFDGDTNMRIYFSVPDGDTLEEILTMLRGMSIE